MGQVGIYVGTDAESEADVVAAGVYRQVVRAKPTPAGAMAVKTIAVGTTPVRACVGSAPLAGRHLLHLQGHPSNTSALYFGAASVDPAGDYFLVLYPGSLPVELALGDTVDVFVVADAAGQKLPCAELTP